MLKKMKILIIGSKGFIGNHVLNFFKNNKHEVYGCDVVTTYDEIDYFQIEATNSDYHFIFQNNLIDVCVNCSGAASVALSIQNPLKDFNLNTVNVFKLLEAIRLYQPQCKFINLSSAAVYGNPISLPIQENFPLNPMSPYGIHKMQAEQIVQEFHLYYKLKTCSLRIFSAYGEGLRKQLLWDMYQKFQNDNSVELFGTGNETRDFIYIDDLCKAISCVIQNNAFEGNEINVANGEEFTINDIATIFKEILQSDKPISFNNIVKSGDPLNWRADVSILKEMGYRPSVSIYEGIKKYIQWIKELK